MYIVYPCGFCFPTPTFANPDGFMRKVMRIKLTFVRIPFYVYEVNVGKSSQDRNAMTR